MINIRVMPGRRISIKIILWLSMIMAGIPSLAQNPSHQRDSLLKLVTKSSVGKNSVGTLNALAKTYWNIKNDSAIFYADSALKLASRLGNVAGQAEGSRIIGVTKWYQQKKPEEIKPFLETALRLYKSAGNNKGMADSYNNLGSFWKYAENNSLSLLFYDSSLAIYRKLDDKKGEAAVLNYIGIVYQSMGEFSKAIDYTLQGLMIRQTTDDDMGIVYSYLNVGNIFLAGGQPERAIKYYQDGIDYAHSRKMEPPSMAYNVLGNAFIQIGDLVRAGDYLLPFKEAQVNEYPDQLLVAKLYLAKGELDSAALYFRKVLDEPGKSAREDRLAQAMAGEGRVLQKKGQVAEALVITARSYDMSVNVNKLTHAESAGILSELYENQGQIGKALSYLKIQHGILDSITNRNYQNKLAYFETSAEMEKVQARLQSLSAQKTLQEKLYQQEKLLKNVLIGISILLVVAAFFVFKNMNARREKIQLQNELLDDQNRQVKKAFEELKSAQAQLIQSEKMASLGELTAGIAHEIQNPLNFVNNFSEINQELISDLSNELGKGNTSEAKAISANIRENEDKILFHGKRADAIVKSMLQHSRISSNIREPVDVSTLTEEYLRLAYHGYQAKDKSFQAILKTDFDKSLPKINAIPQDIGRALLNLFNNAFYAVSERKRLASNGFDPSVIVSTKKHDDKVEIRIGDNGAGIPEKLREKIMQPFFTTKPTGQGTGLGLSLSYDIIKAHGGDLFFETAEGSGSTFIVSLPA